VPETLAGSGSDFSVAGLFDAQIKSKVRVLHRGVAATLQEERGQQTTPSRVGRESGQTPAHDTKDWCRAKCRDTIRQK